MTSSRRAPAWLRALKPALALAASAILLLLSTAGAAGAMPLEGTELVHDELEVMNPGDRTNWAGDEVSFTVHGYHPDGRSILWSAIGLPPGLAIDPVTGVVSGTISRPQGGTPARFIIVVTATLANDDLISAEAVFEWTVAAAPDLPPQAVDDVVVVATDAVPPEGRGIEPLVNDTDPDGGPLRLVGSGPVQEGVVSLADSHLVFQPPAGWQGMAEVRYWVEDSAGNRAGADVMIKVEHPTEILFATGALAIDPMRSHFPDFATLGSLTATNGTETLVSSVFQSLYALRLPIVLLGGAMFWSLFFGGLLNVAVVRQGKVPRLVRRASRTVAIVMAPQGGRVEMVDHPDDPHVVAKLKATRRGIRTLNRRYVDSSGVEWEQVALDGKVGWVDCRYVTEEVDRSSFAMDPRVAGTVRHLISCLRARHEFCDLVSSRGLYVSHYGPLIHFESVEGIMDDDSERVWKGRNPAYPDFAATFDLAIATSVLDAFDHPHREILHDIPIVPSTVIPVEFTNFHFVSIGADLHGPDRLEQSAWLVVFSYEGARPRIVGLVREG